MVAGYLADTALMAAELNPKLNQGSTRGIYALGSPIPGGARAIAPRRN